MVELGNAGDGDGLLGGVEVDYLLRVLLEGEDDGVGGEDGEVGVQFLCESIGDSRDAVGGHT